ncbi:unspecific monooxygenase [Aeromicrobium marinum DSM 15272]|uniref:Unspecific monooxygenase n=1 Tax=Aeromicrobium marinum DSM 15272 TaxID=585531 RepID=E2SC06_9ACTN|nr:cytochrome P450 [Aeromicrobium marinum]EFQ83292.1 unspecific monooxygenase [Aeromicrobium marinum DSM 15272]
MDPTGTTDELPGIPAGPRGSVWRTTWRFMRDRKELIPRLHEQYGDTFSLQIMPGPRTFVVFSDPADVKEIFAADPAQFHAGEGNAILGPVMGENSVLLVDDAAHQRARKLLMPAFSGAPMRGYVPLVEAVAKAEVDSWDASRTLVTLDRMNAITLEIILRVVFGVTDPARLDALRPMVNRMVDIDAKMLLAWSYPRLAAVPPWRGYFRNQAAVDELLYAEIRERRAATDLDVRDDVLSRLLRVGGDDTAPLTDTELRDQLVTLLLAGHETTASALSWTLHELGRDPERHALATAAADEGDDAYLEACLKEAMRLHPVIDFVARTLQSEQVVGGRRLPRGVTVTPSIMLSHSREQSFADAHLFRPERFTAGEVAPNTWIPFGGGARRCLGAAFSLMEGTVVLREVLLRHTVHADRPAPNLLRNITNVPGDRAPLTLTPR